MRNVSLTHLLIAVALAFALPAGAQSVAEREQRLRQAIQHLRNADRRATAYEDSLQRVREPMDTLTVATLHIVAPRSLNDLARQAGARAAREVDSLVGPVAARRLDKHRLVVTLTWRRDSTVQVASLEPNGTLASGVVGGRDVATTAVSLRQIALRLLGADFDTAFLQWLKAPEVDPYPLSALGWARARLTLVSEGGAIGRRCYSGDVQACAMLLGTVPVEDPVRVFYDAKGRRDAVENNSVEARRFDNGATSSCLSGFDDSCAHVLRNIGWDLTPAPRLRHTLTRLAIQVGGPDAFGRLLNSRGSPPDRLAMAAGISADSVVRLWQHNIREVRVPSVDMDARIVLVSLMWIAAFGALSLRSSRWR